MLCLSETNSFQEKLYVTHNSTGPSTLKKISAVSKQAWFGG
ncbi:unnamed protein product [Rhodiola kirilowii]